MPETIPSLPDGTGLRFAVLTAQWHGEITGRLQTAALKTLTDAGVKDDDILVIEVPGAYELPQTAMGVAKGEDVDAVIALGCVVRGETPHFDYVAGCCAEGLQQVGLETGIPVTMGVITANTLAQAEARSGDGTGKGGNKGIESTDAALRMAATYRTLESRRRRS